MTHEQLKWLKILQMSHSIKLHTYYRMLGTKTRSTNINEHSSSQYLLCNINIQASTKKYLNSDPPFIPINFDSFQTSFH